MTGLYPDRKPLARDELTELLRSDGSYFLAEEDAASLINAVLDNLPLVLEAAREAGKASPLRFTEQARVADDGFTWWRLI